VRHRYPFEALQWLRRQRVDREAAVLSERAARSSLARAEELRAQAARQNAERQIHELSEAEQARLEEGAVRVGDLAQVGAWRIGADAQLRAKAAHEQRAAEAVRTEAAAEVAARRALGIASSEAELIDTHRVEWRAEREALRERAEEEASVEQWTAKRYPPRG
jgi:predicted ribonuclease toxin of YeeF-YezG toxin-antitoxin module